MVNKHLIILFGQYRNFDYIAPQLKFDGFDVIASTWDMKFSGDRGGAAGNWRESISEDDILKYIPNAKVLIWNHELSEQKFKFRNTANMLFHMKEAMSKVEQIYDSITLHRFDLFSNFHEIQSIKLEDNVFYCDTTNEIETHFGDTLRIQDWMFFGKHNIVKTYIDTFRYEDILDAEAHLVQGEHLVKKNIPNKRITGTGIKYRLLKDFNTLGYSKTLNEFNSMGYKYFDDIEKNNKYSKMFESLILGGSW